MLEITTLNGTNESSNNA